METKAISLWSIQIENSKRAIKKIRFTVCKQSWNQRMAAYDSDIEDFETHWIQQWRDRSKSNKRVQPQWIGLYR